MRLGGPLFADCSDPDRWAAAVKAAGYRAAYCPVDASAPDDVVRAYALAAARADIVLAEVGAWSNPLSPDDGVRSEAIALCRRQLDLADRIGARCCVNIAGSRGEKWDGPCAEDLAPETFDLVVESVRSIVDAVKPTRTYYTLETMPWMLPDSTDSYLELIAAIDRPAFAVHFDPVNLVCSPQCYFDNAALMRDFVRRLGPRIRSVHVKDIRLAQNLTVHLDEVRPGAGALDHASLLMALNTLDPNLPIMLEHLATEEDYRLAADHIRSVAATCGVAV